MPYLGNKPLEITTTNTIDSLVEKDLDRGGSLVSGGSGGAYTLTTNQTVTSYSQGLAFVFEANHETTGASTLNVDGLGAKAIRKYNNLPLDAGDIKANQMVHVAYEASSDTLQLLSPVPDPKIPIYGHNGSLAPHENLVITNNASNPTTQVDLTADMFVVTTENGQQARLTSVSETITITTSGSNGLDTGSEAISTWYHIWVLYNGTNVTAVFSTSSTFSGVTKPPGYTYGGYAGAIYNDGSGNLIGIYQRDKKVGRPTLQVSSGSATTYTAVDLSGAIPITAKMALVNAGASISGTSLSMFVSGGTVNGVAVNEFNIYSAVGNATSNGNWHTAPVVMVTPQQIEYYVSSGSQVGAIKLIGWEY